MIYLIIVWYLVGLFSYIYWVSKYEDIGLFLFVFGLMLAIGGPINLLMYLIDSNFVIIKKRKNVRD
jgi:hypothetical protein